jgi:hypothetical protein
MFEENSYFLLIKTKSRMFIFVHELLFNAGVIKNFKQS